jgi:hypothetical protein
MRDLEIQIAAARIIREQVVTLVGIAQAMADQWGYGAQSLLFAGGDQ